jgi:Pregnancy-associated plasma protein-A/Secretion system C-terminal sorting domain/Calx-beta domain
MKKIYLLLFVTFSHFAAVFAQQSNDLFEDAVKRCGTAEVLDNFLRANPGSETAAQFEAWINRKIAERKANPFALKITPGVVIPVVFHIIHNNETVGTGRNIPQAAVLQQVLQINKDFGNYSNSTYAVSEDMGIQFALAQNDPGGVPLAEPGIDRIDLNSRGWIPIGSGYTVGFASAANNYLTNTIKPASIWDPNRYLNIWVCQWEATILGIATFPAISGLPGLSNAETNFTAGVSIDFTTVGSIFAPTGGCTLAYGRGKTLTHELGHFFGLRHIWGDGNCATDYCGDTPTHQTSNSGEPIHPKPNSCGTADEQFENYMDYCNDLVANTFTINQGDRMEAVFANSPRRASLATSNAGLVPVAASNRIAFADCDGILNISEASGMTTCPKFRDLSFQVNVEDKATAATTVTVVTGGTAVNGVDYILNSPTLAFAAGDQSKGINIRIIDDGVGTGNKTITLSFSIGAGGGVTAGTLGQTMTINITDDDAVRTVNNSNPTTTLLSENFGTTPAGGALPAGWLKGFFTSGPNTWTVNADYGAATGFTPADGRALHITDGIAADQTAETATNTYTITTATNTNAIAITRSINTLGYKNIRLSFDFACQGELIGSTLFDFGRLRYTIATQTTGLTVVTNSAGNPYYFYNTPGKTSVTLILPAATENVTNLWLGFEWFNNTSGGSNPPFIVDNIVVTGDALGVETVLNQTSVQSLNGGQTAQYISGNNILATVANPNQNIGCVTATVTSAGAGLTALNTNAGSYLRSDKVISLTPAAANTTAAYQATFYYTTAELAAWGVDVPNLKLMKVANGVNLSSTITGANAVLFTPTVNDQRVAAGYVSFSINVTGGFSQFLLVSPLTAVPVNLLSFQARPNGKTILLNWSTAAETNNKGFTIERSTDGAHFEPIGWMDGAINSSRQTNYRYADNFVQPGKWYYYRLRQTDLDRRENLSDIRQAKLASDAILQVTISPNPASDEVKVFVFGSKGLSNLNLLDAEGRLVKSWKNLNLSAAAQTLDISKIASGIYMLQVINTDGILTQKIIVQ